MRMGLAVINESTGDLVPRNELAKATYKIVRDTYEGVFSSLTSPNSSTHLTSAVVIT